METPLEGNAFTKAMADNDGNYKAAKQQLEGSPTQMNGLLAQQMTNVPPAGSSLVNPFSPQAQANAQGIYGGIDQRQNSVGAPLMFENKDKGNDEKSKSKNNIEKSKSKNNIDKTTGKPYDDSEKGRKERLKREQAAGTRDEYGYQTSSY